MVAVFRTNEAPNPDCRVAINREWLESKIFNDPGDKDLKPKTSLGEFEFVERIKSRFKTRSPSVLLGIGDDAAYVTSNPVGSLVTVDMLMEGVHFDLKYFEPEELGHKALAVNLSDIAAMGGRPQYVLASLGIREGLDTPFLERLFDGFGELVARHHLSLIGGNLTRSPHSLVLDIILMGTPHRKVFTRTGANVGDRIAVTGKLGLAAAGFWLLQNQGRSAIKDFPIATGAQLKPNPRIEEGLALAEWGGVSSAIDVSDGLSSELGHLAKASGVGFRILQKHLPIGEETSRCAALAGKDPLSWALHGGEDYELLFTFDPSAGAPPIPYFEIGEVREAKEGNQIISEKGKSEVLLEIGWDHFR